MHAWHQITMALYPGSATYTRIALVCVHAFIHAHECERIQPHYHIRTHVHRCMHTRKLVHAHTQTRKPTGTNSHVKLMQVKLIFAAAPKLEKQLHMAGSSTANMENAAVLSRKNISLYIFHLAQKTISVRVVAKSINVGPGDWV